MKPNAVQDNPATDGWDTEVLSDQAAKILRKLAAALNEPPPVDLSSVKKYLAQDVVYVPPVSKPSVVDSLGVDGIQVEHGASAEGLSPARGLAGLAEALGKLATKNQGTSASYVAVKLWTIDLVEDGFVTKVYLETHDQRADGARQDNLLWRVHWRGRQADQIILQRIEVLKREAVELKNPSGTLFSDVTEAVMGQEPAYGRQVLRGANYWLPSLDNTIGFELETLHGGALGDVNGDGLDDLYVSQTGGLPNLLFVAQRDGRFKEMGAAAGVDYLELTRAALFLDLDNDGDQDLVVAGRPRLILLENDGTGRFSRRALLESGPDHHSLSAVDYDRDGLLDIYISNYRSDEQQESTASVPRDVTAGGPNVMLRNLGNWVFKDVTAAVGLNAGNHLFTYASAWEDIDNDGDMDLYVANDYGVNNLYRNDGGSFTDVASTLDLSDNAFGMGVAFGDVDRDGRMDIHVSNMFSAAGNRITTQRNFQQGMAQNDKALFTRWARGNSLFQNQGETFTDVSDAAGITMGRWAWSSQFADLNNDGFEDLLVSNGYITSHLTDDL